MNLANGLQRPMRRFILFALVSFAGAADLTAGTPQSASGPTAVELIPGGTVSMRRFTSLVLARFRERVQDSRRAAQHRSFLFTGEISRMDTVPRARCQSGVENRVAYKVIQPLWINPDSYATRGYVVAKGVIDCTQKQLPTPQFAVHA